MALHRNWRYRPAPGIRHRRIAGQSIVMGATGVLYTFAGSGGVVWPLIAGGAPLGRAITALARRYRIDPARAQRDVMVFVRALETRGLVRRRPVGGQRARG